MISDMTQQELESFILSLENVQREENMGYIFFFVGDYHMVPFATIGYADNVGDSVSNLSREGVFRLNMGVSKETFTALLPDYNPTAEYDFTKLDVFLPHPHYAVQSYICILNPSDKHEEQVKRYLEEAHVIATRMDEIRKRKQA